MSKRHAKHMANRSLSENMAIFDPQKPAGNPQKKTVARAIQYGTQIHILHMTTARELEFFEAASVEDKKITVEACPHHLWFSEEDYDRLGSHIKCNPAIKTAADRHALREALKTGLIDTVGTDHAPHLFEEKNQSYFKAPSGMPVVQSALPVLFEFMTPDRSFKKPHIILRPFIKSQNEASFRKAIMQT